MERLQWILRTHRLHGLRHAGDRDLLLVSAYLPITNLAESESIWHPGAHCLGACAS